MTTNQYEKLVEYLQNQNYITTNKELTHKIFETEDLIDKSQFHTLSFHQSSISSSNFDITKFENLMRSKLIEDFKKSQQFERPYISVTEICGCLRESYYFRKNYFIDLEQLFRFAYLYLIQKVGQKIHKIVQDVYGFSEVEKKMISKKYHVKGRVDAVDNNIVYEIKTVDPVKFDKNKDFNNFYDQANIYAYILNNEYKYNISTLTIVCVSRDLKKIFPSDFEVQSRAAEIILNRALLLKSCLENNKVPDPYGSSIETCTNCLFRKYCQDHQCKEVFQPFLQNKTKQKNKVVKDNTEPKYDKTAFLL